MPAPALFVDQVRHALAHLYDPDVLRTHPLVGLLGLGARSNPHSVLRDMLMADMESLRPVTTVPVTSRAWRAYKVLQCRYMQQLDQEQTAAQLGVGSRHVRREQHTAIAALADVLYQKYAQQIGAALPDESVAAARLGSELSWLKEGGQDESAPVADVLAAAQRLAAPLASSRSVVLEPAVLPDLPHAAIHPTALRQALVSATTFAIRKAPGGRVRFAARSEGGQIVLTMQAQAGSGATLVAAGDEAASLQAAGAIVKMAGGKLDVVETSSTLTLTLALAAASPVDILLIDDNADFAQLFARYVAGTRYRLQQTSATDLFDLLAAGQSQIVVLDVMMPGIDGWEILGRLRQHPLTSALPIIVCTILPERDLALALGASGFLAKPVTRQGLLEALDQAQATTPKESH